MLSCGGGICAKICGGDGPPSRSSEVRRNSLRDNLAEARDELYENRGLGSPARRNSDLAGSGSALGASLVGFRTLSSGATSERRRSGTGDQLVLGHEVNDNDPIGRGENPRDVRSIQGLLLKQSTDRRLENFYEKTSKKMGEGAFGDVWKVKHRVSGQVRVVKRVKLSTEEDMEAVSKELSAVLELDHPNVVKCHDWFEDESTLYMVLEMCEGGEVNELLEESCGNPSDTTGKNHGSGAGAHGTDRRPKLADVMWQIFAGVNYCHGLAIVHRDLKLENCLLKKKNDPTTLVKIIDFGLSAINATGKAGLQTRLGTPFFIAPEVIDTKVDYGEKCDIWSCGVMLYVMLTGSHPFYTKDCNKPGGVGTRRLFKRIQEDAPHPKPLEKISAAGKDLILKCLEKRQELRPSANECLKHDFFRNVRLGREKAAGEGSMDAERWAKNALDFCRADKFSRVVFLVAAHQAQQKDIEKIQRAFLQIDSDLTGLISLDEFKQAFRNTGAFQDLTEEQLVDTFELLDGDGTGQITYTEWIAAVFERSLFQQEDTVQKAFQYFDLDANGEIDLEELATALEDDAEAVTTMQQLDLNNSGTLSYEEFKKFVLAKLGA